MRLVLDTNVLIAALIKDSLTRQNFFENLPGIDLWKTADIKAYLQKKP